GGRIRLDDDRVGSQAQHVVVQGAWIGAFGHHLVPQPLQHEPQIERPRRRVVHQDDSQHSVINANSVPKAKIGGWRGAVRWTAGGLRGASLPQGSLILSAWTPMRES